MSKAKTNAHDALRALIAERQQYDQWIATLESKRAGTSEHVFNRVYSDYRSRLDRVLGEIRTHGAELQLSITTLSDKLGEVDRDEQSRREALQEAELRATVGEYAEDQWENLRVEGERELERVAADKAALESQLNELRAIQRLSEVGSSGNEEQPKRTESAKERDEVPLEIVPEAAPAREPDIRPPAPIAVPTPTPVPEPAFAAIPTPGEREIAMRSAPEPQSQSARSEKGESATVFTPKRSTPTRPEQAKTLKCPECGTANYPTEWYCEKCGGELATM
jgi:hypothetical protein